MSPKVARHSTSAISKAIAMWEDPIVKKTRAAREKLVAEFGGDLDALWEHLQAVQDKYRDRVVTGQPKTPVRIEGKIS